MKLKTKLYASLKVELLEDIRKDISSLLMKSNLELKDDVTQYLNDRISSNKVEVVVVGLEKGQEAVNKCISIIKANVMQTWVEMGKDAKAQAEHAEQEIKANAPCIAAMKKLKGTSMDKMEMINTTLEEAKRKALALHV